MAHRKLDTPELEPQNPVDGAPAPAGTLVWIGSVDAPQCIDAYRYCAEHAPQIAPRRTLEHLLHRPAERVGRIIYVRLERSPPPTELAELTDRFPSARRSVLLGSECEGEQRSGTRWPGFDAFYWHRWNQVLPEWLAPEEDQVVDAAPPSGRRRIRRSVGIVASSRASVDAVADWIADQGHTVFWTPQLTLTAIRNMDVCLWDDSVATPASTSQWRERLAEISRTSGRAERIRHIWMAGFPRVEDWTAARRAGVEAMLSKPFTLRALEACLSGSVAAPALVAGQPASGIA